MKQRSCLDSKQLQILRRSSQNTPCQTLDSSIKISHKQSSWSSEVSEHTRKSLTALLTRAVSPEPHIYWFFKKKSNLVNAASFTFQISVRAHGSGWIMWLSAGGEQRAPRKKRKLNFKPKSWENKRHRAAPQRPLMTEKPVSQRPVLFYFYARVLNDYCELLTKRMSLLLRKRPLSFPGFKSLNSSICTLCPLQPFIIAQNAFPTKQQLPMGERSFWNIRKTKIVCSF